MRQALPDRAYSARGVRLFGLYARGYFRRHFTGLRISNAGKPPPLGANVILYANHPSWWDPLVMLLLANGPLAGKRIFAPIDAEALRRYPVLRRLGLFPIDVNSVSGSRRFLWTANRLLENSDNLLAVTAQGRLVDHRVRPLGLRNGVARLLHEDSSRSAVPVALEYTHWNDRLPEALVHFGRPLRAAPGERVADTGLRLAGALQSALDELAHASMLRDPTLFQTLLGRTRTDVDGIYGMFRRIVGLDRHAGLGIAAARTPGTQRSVGNDSD